jgi:hypothetical protein
LHVTYLSFCILEFGLYKITGTRWRSWLRHCAESRKVTGSIPDGIIEIFDWPNLSGMTMALGSTQPLTEMNTRDYFIGADSLIIFMC